MVKKKRLAAQTAENALAAQAFAGHTPQTQLKIAKTRSRTGYKTCLNKVNSLISENADPGLIKQHMHALTNKLAEYTAAIHALVDVTDEDKVEPLLAEIEQDSWQFPQDHHCPLLKSSYLEQRRSQVEQNAHLGWLLRVTQLVD